MGLRIFAEFAKMSLELLGLLLELLLLLLLLLLLNVLYHVLIRGREAPPYNYVINTYSIGRGKPRLFLTGLCKDKE